MMPGQVMIRMMGLFTIEADGTVYDTLVTKNRRGISLMQYLILEEGRPVSVQRLKRELWPASRSENPENALKTAVSRLRTTLSQISPALACCIVSDRGTYRWHTPPDVRVDVLEILEILRALREGPSDDQIRDLTVRLMDLYRGDLFLAGDLLNGITLSNWLHNEYLTAVYRYVDLLKRGEEYNRVCEVCQQAVRVDALDDQLHIELMQALVNLNRADQAQEEYRRLIRRSRRLLDAEPSEALKSGYAEVVEMGKTLRLNIDVIRNELMDKEGSQRGPFFCEYEVFKEVYNIYMRNLERLGSTMFLAIIMLGQPGDGCSAARRESCMAALHEILKSNMRKGDIITRFSDTVYAMLLPTVNYQTGSLVMERLENLYYQEIPDRSIPFHTRVVPLGTMR